MSKYIHERELGEVYAIELDVIAEMIEGFHPRISFLAGTLAQQQFQLAHNKAADAAGGE